MELLFEITKKFQERAGVMVTRIVHFKVAKTENFILYYFTIKKKFQLKKKVRDTRWRRGNQINEEVRSVEAGGGYRRFTVAHLQLQTQGGEAPNFFY